MNSLSVIGIGKLGAPMMACFAAAGFRVTAVDLAGNEEDRSILHLIFARQVMAWPFLGPPGMPADGSQRLIDHCATITKQ